MKKTSIYLDTSIINFLFADDAPDKRDVTREFFETQVRLSLCDVWISPAVIEEIRQTPDPAKRHLLLAVIDDYGLEVAEIERNREEMQALARAYIQAGIIPKRKVYDAMHVAIATVNGFDVLLSWN